MFRWYAVDKHVCLGSNDGGVDKAEEEKATDE